MTGDWPQQLARTLANGLPTASLEYHLDPLLIWLGNPDNPRVAPLDAAIAAGGLTRGQAAERAYDILDRFLFDRPGAPPHRVLGLADAGDAQAAKQRYRCLVQAYHPDRHPARAHSLTERAEQINLAYAALERGDRSAETKTPAGASPVPSGGRQGRRRAARGGRTPRPDRGDAAPPRATWAARLAGVPGGARTLEARFFAGLILFCAFLLASLSYEGTPRPGRLSGPEGAVAAAAAPGSTWDAGHPTVAVPTPAPQAPAASVSGRVRVGTATAPGASRPPVDGEQARPHRPIRSLPPQTGAEPIPAGAPPERIESAVVPDRIVLPSARLGLVGEVVRPLRPGESEGRRLSQIRVPGHAAPIRAPDPVAPPTDALGEPIRPVDPPPPSPRQRVAVAAAADPRPPGSEEARPDGGGPGEPSPRLDPAPPSSDTSRRPTEAPPPSLAAAPAPGPVTAPAGSSAGSSGPVTPAPDQSRARAIGSSAKAAAPRAAPAAAGPCGGAARTLDRFRQAYDAGALERLLALYSADARENQRSGWSAIRQLYADWFGETSGRRMAFHGTAVRTAGRNRCAVSSGFRVRYRDRTGRPVERSGTIEFLLERRESDLRILRVSY